MRADHAAGVPSTGAKRFANILLNAEKDGTADPAYSSIGRWATLAFEITGDVKYATKAKTEFWEKAADHIVEGDNIREYFVETAWMFETLRPTMDAAEISRWIDWHRDRADRVVGRGAYVGTATGDSDQCLGAYLGLALWDLVLGTNYLEGTFKDHERPTLGELPVGGLRATGANRDTMRNAVDWYFTLAEGGNWIETGMYNAGTTQWMYMGIEFIRRITGDPTLFPLERAFRQAHVHQVFHELTPDLKDLFQHGDEQNPGSLHYMARRPMIMILAGITGDGRLEQLDRDILAANAGNTDFRPHVYLAPRAFLFANPYLEPQPWRDSVGLSHVSPGQGHVYVRSGWGPADTAVHVYWPGFINGAVHHYESLGPGSLRIYEAGRWVQTHPFAYGPDKTFHNYTLTNGMSPSLEATRLIAFAMAPGVFGYAAGLSCGISPEVWEGAQGDTPTLLHEDGRSVFTLFGSEPLTIVFDRLHVDDVKQTTTVHKWPPFNTRTWLDHYPYESQRRKIQAAGGIVDTLWHAPVAPTVSGDTVSFPVGAMTVRIQQVWPADEHSAFMIVDEATDPTIVGAPYPDQKKFAIHAVTNQTGFFTKLTVIQASPSNARPAATVTAVDLGELQGARITREGQPDVVVLFSAKPGPRIESTFIDNRVSYSKRFEKFERVRSARLVSSLPTLPTDADLYIADIAGGVIAPGLTQVGDMLVGRASVTTPSDPPPVVPPVDPPPVNPPVEPPPNPPAPPPVEDEERIVAIPSGVTQAKWNTIRVTQANDGYESAFALSATKVVFKKREKP